MKKRHVAGWLLLASVLLGLWVWQAVQEETTSSTRAALATTSAPVDELDLRVDLWAAAANVVGGHTLPVTITIYNPTKDVVHMRFVRFEHPGFDPANAKCWAGDKPVCVEGTAVRAAVPYTIAAHDSVTFTAALTAQHAPGRYAIAAVVAWGSDPKNVHRVTRRKQVALRPITIESAFENGVLLFLRAFQSFVKDLALPLALAFLGFWLKKQEDTRAEEREREETKRADLRRQDEEDRAQRRKDEEEARALRRREEEEARLEQRKAAAEKNAQTQQTWNIMLLKSHQNAERHYMPIGTAAKRIGEYWRASTYGDPADRAKNFDQCFFSFLLFLSRMRRMIRSIGGFYFKSRRGEVAARLLWTKILKTSDALFGRDVRERATKAVMPQWMYADYCDDASEKKEVRTIKELFRDNSEKFEALVPAFEAFALVLEFEMNRPYEHWYGHPEPFDTEAAQELVQKLRASSYEEFRELGAAFEAYAIEAANVAPSGADTATG
ncbi:MAG: hypothetical protein M3Q69_04310 [Acidobacteriota bacterium]|nr:hypothetical protein [Acidobacteriota bacterium]